MSEITNMLDDLKIRFSDQMEDDIEYLIENLNMTRAEAVNEIISWDYKEDVVSYESSSDPEEWSYLSDSTTSDSTNSIPLNEQKSEETSDDDWSASLEELKIVMNSD
jgi:hypothetical protein